MDPAYRPWGVEILLAASCYRKRDKLRQLNEPVGSKASQPAYLHTYFSD